LTQKDIISEIALNTGLKKKDVSVIVNAFLFAIKRALTDGETVNLRGFGKFSLRLQKERTIKHPKTGKSIKISSMMKPTFKASKLLKEAISID
jgi:DNA-binding protein HU-beta/integration host factor subunit beta